MIGLYTLDLTVTWTEKDKLLAYKWFALIDPDEPQEGITVCIHNYNFMKCEFFLSSYQTLTSMNLLAGITHFQFFLSSL